MESRDIIANVGGSSSEGAGSKAGSDSTSVLQDFAQQLMAEVVRTNRGQDYPSTEMGCSIDQFTRLKPSVFIGSVDPVRAKNCIQEIEKILDVLNCTEKQKVTFAMFKLSGEVERWWVSVKKMEEHRPIPAAMTWARFKELFFEWYFSAMVRNAKMEKFMNMMQELLTVATLVDKATVVKESLLEDAEVQVPKKRPMPPSSSSGAKQVLDDYGRLHAGNSGAPQQPYRGNAQAQHGGQQGGTTQARVYSLTPSDAENAGDVVTYIIYMLSHKVVVFFDSKATHSFVSCEFVKLCGLGFQLLDYELVEATPYGSVVGCGKVVCDFLVEIQGRVLPVDLVVYDMYGFDIILGMDWLSASYANIDCHRREAKRLLLKGCQGYLAFVKDALVEERKLEMIAIMHKFLDVFPEDLPGLSPDHEVEFVIELTLDMTPISKAPYLLTIPSGDGGFVIYSDTSKKGLGYVLMQQGRVVTYASRQLKDLSSESSASDLYGTRNVGFGNSGRKSSGCSFQFDGTTDLTRKDLCSAGEGSRVD
ncbi:uncharacterized protein LOC131162691 [Malania oleifera]|uniref:uncharacterized protein LOC131162691 n=1 Tax=Malania oleifera TaxID=397392 RepID=UPI0025ADF9DD|nr:uncharacterized protein LOC131162691 [Malania oleifera]